MFKPCSPVKIIILVFEHACSLCRWLVSFLTVGSVPFWRLGSEIEINIWAKVALEILIKKTFGRRWVWLIKSKVSSKLNGSQLIQSYGNLFTSQFLVIICHFEKKIQHWLIFEGNVCEIILRLINWKFE